MIDAIGRGYRIFTDATADFCASMLQGLPRIEVIPMEIAVGADGFLYGPGGDLSVPQFYAMQRGGRFATTSQINPAAYRSAFETALRSGCDVLYLGFSSGLSGTCNAARLCMNELQEEYPARRLICLDTLCASVGEAFLVREAARKQGEGLSIAELAAWVDGHKLKVCHWFTVDVFDHLVHGGRVSAASAAIGGMLNIKPMLHVDAAGRLAVMKRPRGRHNAIREQIMRMKEGWQPELGRLVVIGHGDDLAAATLLKRAVAANFPEADVHIAEIGPIIGAHTGPGMLALLYWGNNR